jgi:hypothetical protein
MQWSDISFAPSSHTLRQFGGIWIAFFGGFAAWQGLVRGHTTLGWVLAGLAITVGPVGLVWPRLIRPIYVGWMILAFPIGWTVSKTVLALLYYLIFTPIALIFRLTGRDALALRPARSTETYWTEKPRASSARSYLRQF